MRLSRILPTMLALLLCVGLYVEATFNAPESHAHGSVLNPMGGPLANLPLCGTEDGSGMALCVWQGEVQGNGEGSTIISGDCAPTYVGSDSLMRMCVRLYESNSGDDAQDCNSEYENDIVELKHCYARFLGEENLYE